MEGAGKLRVFAIPSQLKECLFLYCDQPWAMDTLRLIPMDGTYDQCKPFALLFGVNIRMS
jgi:hypothetical protein